MKPIQQLTDDELLQRLHEASTMPDAPPALIRKAITLMPVAQSATLMDTARAALQSVVAALTFDSWAGGTLAYGVRGVPSDVRHLLYSALGRDVDVRVSPAAGNFILAGQVLGPDETGSIELTSAGDDGGAEATMARMAKVVELDPMGQFRIEGVPSGAYVLRLKLGDDEIVLPAIDLGERRA